MAAAWMRSLSCKSSAVADDAHRSPPRPLLPVSKDRRTRTRVMRPSRKKAAPQAAQLKQASPLPARARPSFLTMTELPEGDSSRRVVELIFSSGWSAADDPAKVEALFRLHSTPRAVARFEDARAAARARAAEEARCAADGNEMMRFQCRAAEGDGDVICAAVATCSVGPATSAVSTFAGSGAAHAGAGGGPGRRAMLVCRVIAGRVRTASEQSRHASQSQEYDSLDMGGGELVVLDSRAVLPCFLVIYKVSRAACM